MSQHLSVPPTERPAPPRSAACACQIVLVALVVVLVPGIASGSLPDPTWLPGVYDSADGDDVVTLIGNLAAANVASGGRITSLPHAREDVPGLEVLAVERPRAGSLARGPPLA